MSQKILCIEDNPDNALILKTILHANGYTVLIARDGHTGVQLANNQHPDLIICDYHLPGENAPEVIQQIRQSPQLKRVPIIILTADVYNGPESQAIGISAYLNKPIKPPQLISAINNIIG